MGNARYKGAAGVGLASLAYRKLALLILEGAATGRIDLAYIRAEAELYVKEFHAENMSYEDEAATIGAGLAAIAEFFASVKIEPPSKDEGN